MSENAPTSDSSGSSTNAGSSGSQPTYIGSSSDYTTGIEVSGRTAGLLAVIETFSGYSNTGPVITYNQKNDNYYSAMSRIVQVSQYITEAAGKAINAISPQVGIYCAAPTSAIPAAPSTELSSALQWYQNQVAAEPATYSPALPSNAVSILLQSSPQEITITAPTLTISSTTKVEISNPSTLSISANSTKLTSPDTTVSASSKLSVSSPAVTVTGTKSISMSGGSISASGTTSAKVSAGGSAVSLTSTSVSVTGSMISLG
jgi:phage baseplate assembly protein gpV